MLAPLWIYNRSPLRKKNKKNDSAANNEHDDHPGLSERAKNTSERLKVWQAARLATNETTMNENYADQSEPIEQVNITHEDSAFWQRMHQLNVVVTEVAERIWLIVGLALILTLRLVNVIGADPEQNRINSLSVLTVGLLIESMSVIRSEGLASKTVYVHKLLKRMETQAPTIEYRKGKVCGDKLFTTIEVWLTIAVQVALTVVLFLSEIRQVGGFNDSTGFDGSQLDVMGRLPVVITTATVIILVVLSKPAVYYYLNNLGYTAIPTDMSRMMRKVDLTNIGQCQARPDNVYRVEVAAGYDAKEKFGHLGFRSKDTIGSETFNTHNHYSLTCNGIKPGVVYRGSSPEVHVPRDTTQAHMDCQKGHILRKMRALKSNL